MKTGTLDPQSNTATFQFEITLIDDDTDTTFDLADVSALTVKLRDIDTEEIVLTGSLGTEVVQVGASTDGLVRVTFAAGTMTSICPKTYEIGALVTETDGFITQMILARVPIVKGL